MWWLPVDTAIHLYRLGWSLTRVDNHLNVTRATAGGAAYQHAIAMDRRKRTDSAARISTI
ncbi:hypothetical protein C5E44_13500 [Nocardia nova]|nr:hypothetical protein C5E44_13500 [Nocardia nova]